MVADSSRADTACERGDDGAERTASARQWYCYLGLRLRLQQGELLDFRAAISGDA